jgi:hypothetical protein
MKSLYLFVFLILTNYSFSQPNPQEAYPLRIQQITAQLKTDSTNYQLIWERLEMQVNLLGGFPTHREIFAASKDSTASPKESAYFKALEQDFNKISLNLIQPKKYDIAEAGDFYLNRLKFNYKRNNINKAIQDAIYLRDSASFSRYSGRGAYYERWANFALYNLSVLTSDFDGALKAVNNVLDKRQQQEPVLFYSTHGSFFSYQDKVRLYDHFNKQAENITYLKETCRAHFNWYFQKSAQKEVKRDTWSLGEFEYYTSKSSFLYYMGSCKHKSFELVELLVDYLEKYNHPDLAKYQAILAQLFFQKNPNYVTINPHLSDADLQKIVASL